MLLLLNLETIFSLMEYFEKLIQNDLVNTHWRSQRIEILQIFECSHCLSLSDGSAAFKYKYIPLWWNNDIFPKPTAFIFAIVHWLWASVANDKYAESSPWVNFSNKFSCDELFPEYGRTKSRLMIDSINSKYVFFVFFSLSR